MMKEECIVSTLLVTLPKEVKNFQINLPWNTKRIIGVELGAIRTLYAETGDYINPELIVFPPGHDELFRIRCNQTFGEISLRCLNKENIFFRGELKDKDSNVFWADYSTTFGNQFREWTHSQRRHEMAVDVEGSSVIECCYKDQWAILNTLYVNYTFHLYLWIEKNDAV